MSNPMVAAGFWSQTKGLGPYACFLGPLLLVPLFIQSPYVIDLLILCNIYAVFLASWDLLTGYTGQISFGHSLFIGAGAYTAGVLNFYFKVPPTVTIPLGGLVAALLGLALGIPALRLKGPYLALVTFIASAIPAALTAIFWEYSGGEDGLYGIAPLTQSPLLKYYLSVALLVVCCGAMLAIVKSQFGLILLSIREDETASAASGINTSLFKVVTFTTSGFFAGIAGAFYAHNQLHVGTEELSLSLSILIVLMSVAGGMGTITGPIFAGFLLILLNEWLRFIEEFRLLIYTGAVVLILLFIPKGLLPTAKALFKALLARIRRSPQPEAAGEGARSLNRAASKQ
ncbi:MAG: branched-chain amino acid ABC transporter permease [Thermodesulfobacteriota bacterium]